MLVAAACASGQQAIVLAAGAVRRGELDCALAAGCDIASEFVTSGFASLGALSASAARPLGAGAILSLNVGFGGLNSALIVEELQ